MIDVWQAEERENCHLSYTIDQASQPRETCVWRQIWGAQIRWLRSFSMGGSRIDRELSHVLEGFGIHLTSMVGEECIHDITKETN